MRLDGKNGENWAVFGLGRSGLSAVGALCRAGARVVAWDDRPAPRALAAEAGADIRPWREWDWRTLRSLVLSPGVPFTHPEPHPVVVAARAAHVPVLGDMALFADAAGGRRIVAVTGTNGKSTVTALLAHVLDACGIAAVAGGNLGLPVLDLPELPEDGVYVIEMSSYQIDLMGGLHPHIGVLLNVTPDHLDRHGGFAGYAAVKERLIARSRRAVIAVDDIPCRRIRRRIVARGGKPVSVASGEGGRGADWYLDDGWRLHRRIAGTVSSLTRPPRLPGAHNRQNVAAVFAAARLLGGATEGIAAALQDFPGLPHRLEEVCRHDGVVFVNDSKATNPEAAAHALESFANIYWIAGGRAKDGGFGHLRPALRHVRRAYLIGEAAAALQAFCKDSLPCNLYENLDAAIAAAYEDARNAGGGVVLLSPACASFDQFASFEARGEHFRNHALALGAANAPERAGGAS